MEAVGDGAGDIAVRSSPAARTIMSRLAFGKRCREMRVVTPTGSAGDYFAQTHADAHGFILMRHDLSLGSDAFRELVGGLLHVDQRLLTKRQSFVPLLRLSILEETRVGRKRLYCCFHLIESNSKKLLSKI